jgi:hypothetical protein
LELVDGGLCVAGIWVPAGSVVHHDRGCRFSFLTGGFAGVF